MKSFFKFGTVGIANTGITIGVYTLLVNLGVNFIAANIFGYILGVLNSYYWNKNWVFKVDSKQNYNNVFIKFILVNLITLLINTIILYILVEYSHIHHLISQIFATGIGMVVNYSINKIWTFNNN